VDLQVWQVAASTEEKEAQEVDFDEKHFLVKKEHMPDGTTKLILREKKSGRIVQKIKKK